MNAPGGSKRSKVLGVGRVGWLMFVGVIGLGLVQSQEVKAMEIAVHEGLVAWSEDGKSALLRVDEYGPEGGGAITYRLLCPEKDQDETFPISSNFSLGGAEEPQRISWLQCMGVLMRLSGELNQRGFKGVRVELGEKDRGQQVEITEAAKQRVTTSAFTEKQGQLVQGELKLKVSGSAVLGQVKGKPDLRWELKGMEQVPVQGLRAYLSSDQGLLLLFQRGDKEYKQDFVGALPLVRP